MVIDQAPNIILTGFMASGKSRIGEMLASRLGYTLYDIDSLIEKEQGQSIKNIFDRSSFNSALFLFSGSAITYDPARSFGVDLGISF